MADDTATLADDFVVGKWKRLHNAESVQLANGAPKTIIDAICASTAKGLLRTALFLDAFGTAAFIGNPLEHRNLFVPNTKYSDLEQGKLGYILGIDIYTDAYLDADKRFLIGSWLT